MTDEECNEINDEVVNDLYHQYECDHDMDVMRYHHPMFYNGTFCKDNSYQPPEPEPLLSKEEFAKKLESYDHADKWTIGYEVLFSYIARLRRREAIKSPIDHIDKPETI